MSSLTKKIDFVLFVSVRQANPNGDPLLGNMPRTMGKYPTSASSEKYATGFRTWDRKFSYRPTIG